MKKVILSIAGLLAVQLASAQDYKNSIGLRLGSGYYDVVAASFKTFISEPAALEFNLGIRPYSASAWNNDHAAKDKWTNVSISGAYQHHFPIASIEGFKWYVGGGIVASNSFSKSDYYSGFNLGIFPTGGVDYKLKNAPFAFSVDLRPTVHIVEAYDYYNGFYFNGGVTARYIF